ncbi:hypothetical protein [Paenibacillus donghaensis]|uniref:Uncharacterized protein n=1 Tax=Paenibacillus donghaensis TaxID=414771 RepID=A0A2Z2KGD8_9BACL|nr:hypothetical protein [Paenibacillus donghaensis]ASA23085.1 hypothetical protein B9T62_21115 [Paenibacillus donghaensis]
MADTMEEWKQRITALQETGEISGGAVALLEEMVAEMAELSRSNKALRRVILKSGQASSMSTRLREALYE